VRTVLGAIAALLGAALLVLSVGAYFVSTFCWEYCEPEDEPTTWDGLQFALPFGLLAIGVMTVAVTLFTAGRGSWQRALVVAVASCVVGGALVVGFGALWDELPAAEVVGAALVALWATLTAAAARRVAVRA
jgi:hypothetical protein